MKPASHLVAWALAVGLNAGEVRAQPAQFMPLGYFPGGFPTQAMAISGDGATVVGRALGGASRAFKWTAGSGLQPLPTPVGWVEAEAHGTSADGSMIVGDVVDLNSGAGVWSGGGVQVLAGLPGSEGCGASGVSADGTVIVGSSYSLGNEAVRWIGGVASGLSDLPGGNMNSHASAASANGSVIVGFGTSASGVEAFRWTQAGGMQGLGDLPGGAFYSTAQAVSADGSVVVGWCNGAPGPQSRAFRWTASGGLQDLGTLTGATSSSAFGVSAAGDVIVGESPFLGPAPRAFVWTAGGGMVELRARMIALGATGLTGWTLERATGISGDGRRIVGYGTDQLGHGQAWLAVLPPPCYPDCNGDGAMNLSDFGCFQTKFALGAAYADCNTDGVLNLSDFGCFQTKFALGCP